MTIKELKEALDKFPEDTKVYVDWDCEGGNEDEATEVILFEQNRWYKGVKIK